MEYTIYEYSFLFLFYSFLGWCAEVCIAAVREKNFVNRGFVSGFFCPIYGFGAVSFAVFLPELKNSLFFLFLAGYILGSLLEFATGVLLEKIFHRKWWDYSKIKWNYGGYVCVPVSVLWGIMAVLTLRLVNPLLVSFLHILPKTIVVIVLLVLFVLLVLDAMGTALTILGMQKKMAQISELSEGMGRVSKILENAITRRIGRRMGKAFPSLELEKLEKQKKEKKEQTVFAEGCSFYKLVSLFIAGAFLGDITETIFCLITTGELMSRSSVVYGPFSIVWGLGCALLTAVLYRIREKGDSSIFIAGVLLGGTYEYVCSVFTELVFGTVFWDYSGFAFNLGGRINLLYCFFWGIAAVVWMKYLYPFLSKWIEKLSPKVGKTACWIIIVFFTLDCCISALALARYTERNTSLEMDSRTELQIFLDEHFTDERMERIYPNAKIVD